MNAATAEYLLAGLLDLLLKGALLYLLAGLVGRLAFTSQPGHHAWLWMSFLISLGQCMLATLLFGPSPAAASLVQHMAPRGLVVLAHAYVLTAALLLGLVMVNVVRQRLLRAYLSPMARSGEAALLESGVSARELGRTARLLRHVDVRRGGAGFMPTSFGILHPTIVVPEAVTGTIARRFSRTCIVHTFTAVLRFDALWALVARGLQAVFFVHPAVWLAWRHYVAAREESADRWTVRAIGDVDTYVEDLQALSRCRRALGALGALAVDAPMHHGNVSALPERIARVRRDASRTPDMIGPRRLAWLTTCALTTAGIVSGLEWRISPTNGALDVGWAIGPIAFGVLTAWLIGAGFLLLEFTQRDGQRTISGANSATLYRQTVLDCVRAIEQDVQLCLSLASRVAVPTAGLALLVFLTVGCWRLTRNMPAADAEMPEVRALTQEPFP